MTVYKGWNAKVLKDGIEIGLCESASVEIATGIEAYYQIGSRTPAELVEGNQEVTGSISRAWINKNYLQLVTGTGSLSDFELRFEIGTGPALAVYCYNCKFESGSIDIPQDGVLMEDYDFRAKSIAIVQA